MDTINLSTHEDAEATFDKENLLLRIIDITRCFLQNTDKEVNYERIAENMRQLANAKYVAFNRFESDGETFSTVGLAGAPKQLEKATEILGYRLIGRKWAPDPIRAEKIKDADITVFRNLRELTGYVIPEKLVQLVERTFSIGQVVIIKILKDDQPLGDFTIFMRNGVSFKNGDVLQIYASLVGLWLEKKKAEQKVVRQKERLENILEATQAGTWIWNAQTDELKVNERWLEILGYSLDDNPIKGSNEWQSLVHPDDLANNMLRIDEMLLKKNRHYTSEFRLKHKNGHYVWIADRGKVMSWADGKPEWVFGTYIDITNRKILQQELRASEEDNRLLLEQMQLALAVHEVILDEKGQPIDYRFIRVNKKFEEQTGLKAEDIIGKTVLEILPNTERFWIEVFGQIALSGMPYKFENFAKGLGKWFSVSAYSPQPMQFATIFNDITELKKANEEIYMKTQELERFFSVNMDLLCIADPEGRLVKVNEAWEAILGYQVADLENRNYLEFVHPDDIPQTFELMGKLAQQEQVLNFVNRYRAFDGSYKYIEWRLHPHGNLIYAAARDITARKEMENRLFHEKELFMTTLLSVGDGIISTDDQGRIVVMNHIAEKLTGWKQQDAFSKPLDEVLSIIGEKNRDAHKTFSNDIFTTGILPDIPDDILLIQKDGSEIPIEETMAPIKDSNGKVIGLVIVFRDVTEKKEKQRQVEYLSFHDHLTGLYNRRYMDDAIRRMDTGRNLPFTLLVADVNGLKLTNDAFGHQAGDELIKTVAEILKKTSRPDDIICRIGGDEFAMLLPDTDKEMAHAIKQRIKEESAMASVDFTIVSVAIGYAVKSEAGEDIYETLRDADNAMYKDKLKYGKTMRSQTVETILLNINNKYDNEQLHSERVAQYCESIASAMGLSVKETEDAKLAGALHDLGKITIPAEVLSKKTPLTAAEWKEIKHHPVTGYQILKGVDEYAGLADFILHHHEHYDGGGYPEGIKGEEIPLISRIIAIAEALETMTSRHSYQEKKTKKQAIAELNRCAGTQFDPTIVKIFIDQVLHE